MPFPSRAGPLVHNTLEQTCPAARVAMCAQALSTLVTKWTFCYTRHLQDTVHDCLQELNDFVADVRDGLTGDLTHISDAELTQAMTRIQNVRVPPKAPLS
eukprot:4261003-Pleurochrysis_carterae.AAC.2